MSNKKECTDIGALLWSENDSSCKWTRAQKIEINKLEIDSSTII